MTPFRKCLIIAGVIEAPMFAAYLALGGMDAVGPSSLVKILGVYHAIGVAGAGTIFMVLFGHDGVGPGPPELWWGLLYVTMFAVQTLILAGAFRILLWRWLGSAVPSDRSDQSSYDSARRDREAVGAAKALSITGKILRGSAIAFATALLLLGLGLRLLDTKTFSAVVAPLSDLLFMICVLSVYAMAISAIAWLSLQVWVRIFGRRAADSVDQA